jgi:hypothetical protein
MSTLLEQASLVLIPSGYKEDVVYSQIPTSGAGDLSFTRASNGTRVNSAGLVEVCPWNLLQQSESIGTSPWTTPNVTITSGQTDPNGGTTAFLVVESIDGGSLRQAITQTGQLCYSIVLKYSSGTNRNASLFCTDANQQAGFDLQNGTITYVSGSTATIESLGNGWYKCAMTFTPSAASTIILFPNYESGVGGVFAWHPQLNIGSTAKPYFPTTDRLNVPRLTYQNGGGGCPSLLLEKQSTNLFTYSEQIDNAAWFYNNLTITANQAISPDGTQNADLLDDGTASSTQHWIYQGTSFSNSTAYTISFYAKYVSRQNMTVNIYNGSSSQYVAYNIQNGTILGSTGDVTASITSVGNGWYRIVYTRTMAASGSPNFRIGLADDTGSETYTGSNKQVYVWGFQCEASSYATSYIPTTSASATRVADVMYVNLPNTDMTFCAYLECDEVPLGTTSGDWFQIYANASADGRAYGYADAFGFANAYLLGVLSGAKMVWKQESGTTAKIFKGGALVATSTTGTYSNPFNRFQISGANLDKPLKVKQFVFFDNNLTDAECIALTA